MRVFRRKPWPVHAAMSEAEHRNVARALRALMTASLKKEIRENPGLEGFEYGQMGWDQVGLVAAELRVSAGRLGAFLSFKGPRESYKFARRVANYAGVPLRMLLDLPVEKWIDQEGGSSCYRCMKLRRGAAKATDVN